MASFYENLQATTSRLLQSKGQVLTFTRAVETGFTPSTGVKTFDDFVYLGNGAVFNYKASEITGELIQKGDIKLILEKTTTAPLIGDSVKIDTVDYRVMDVMTTSPGGTIVKYDLQLRK